MNRIVWIVCTIAACLPLLASAAVAWDINYDGSVLPNDGTLGTAVWTGCTINDVSRCSVQDGVLHLVDQSTKKTAEFYREKMLPKDTPITLEARVRIASGTGITANDAPARIEVGRIDACVFLGLWPDKIKCGSSVHNVDMTSFHVVRVALQSDKHYQVWLDGSQVFSGSTTDGSQAGIVFGSSRSPVGTVDSCWDYVNYSKAYIPIE